MSLSKRTNIVLEEYKLIDRETLKPTRHYGRTKRIVSNEVNMKFLQILVLILGLCIVGNAQSASRETTLKGTIFNQAGGVITDVWITIKNANGKGFTFQPRYGLYRTQIPPGT